MGPPEYIEVVWRGEGRAELYLASNNNMERRRDLQHQLHHNVIKCNISSCSIREFEKRDSISTMDPLNVQEEEHKVTGNDTEMTVPPGVNDKVWQAWLDYWQAWKDIYITLSWVHKHRNVCKADFVAWYDTYLAENSWILPAITEELWSSEEEIITQSNTCPTPCTKQYLTGDHTALFDSDNKLQVIECDGENVSKTEEGSTHIIPDAGNVDNEKSQDVGEVNSCENESENIAKNIKTKEIDGPQISLETDESKNLDGEYEKHSHQRYWIHLRSFLLESGIDVNDEIKKFVTERAGLCCTLHTDNSESSEVNDSVKDNENDTQCASDCEHENLPRKENHQNGEDSIEELAEGHENMVHVTQDEESSTFGTQCVVVGACEEVETNNTCGNGDHNSRIIKSDEYKISTQKVDDCSKICTNVVELSITDPGNDEGSQINTNSNEIGKGPDDCVTMTDNNDFSTPSPSTTRKWKKNKNNKARFDAGIGWALGVINKNNCNSRGGDQEADTSNAAKGGSVNLVTKGSTKEVADSKSSPFSHKREDNISLTLQQNRGKPLDKEDNWRQDMDKQSRRRPLDKKSNWRQDTNLGKQQNNQSQETQTEIVSSKSLNWLPRCLQNSWWKNIAQATFEHILTFSMVFSDGMNQPPLNLKLPFLSPPLDRLQMTKIVNSVGKDDSKVQETERRRNTNMTNSYIEREDLSCEQQLYCWLNSHLCLSSNIPEQETLDSESTLELSGVREETNNQCEKFYYKLKSELEDGICRQDLELLDLCDENGWSREKNAWCELIAGYKQVKYWDQGAPSDLPQELHKYWAQRHRFFIKFDEGIKLDHESWFSVTPEIIAMHQAFRCQSDVVVDAFCGAGGNAIQLARTCCKVIAIDIDPEKIALARHNAEVYQVSHRIQFIVGDFFLLAPYLKADAVLLSPPWGGVDYNGDHMYDVMALGGNMRCDHLMAAARTFTSNIALYIPRNSNIIQILQLAEAGGSLDIESSYMGRKKKALTVYFGALVGDEY